MAALGSVFKGCWKGIAPLPLSHLALLQVYEGLLPIWRGSTVLGSCRKNFLSITGLAQGNLTSFTLKHEKLMIIFNFPLLDLFPGGHF